MHYTTLISTSTLAEHLDDPVWVVVDVRFDLANGEAGRQAYEREHVAGAVFADVNRDLAGVPGGGRGRHPLPPVGDLEERLGGLGIDSGTQVVVYDDAGGAWAARLWWLLRYLGHERVALLDGGIGKWLDERRGTRSGTETRPARAFAARPRPELIVTAEEVEAARGDSASPLVDSRAPDRYRGEVEPIDPVAGHIPGARNRFFKQNLNPDTTMRPAGALREEFETLLGGASPERLIVYCGSGITACQNLLALDHAGLEGARLYPGSWSQWCSDTNRPVATGEE